ncbi:stalk domain-containing protein [Paenibacillus shenyangensis]|uniref:stalk domain-containing protein n=1 Tax=Paenibacillus sp. A9 TaxID=1284352 RepID=UPI0009DA0BCA|nr:stalk domain-containing protein [Paenibacillus sp. A9]
MSKRFRMTALFTLFSKDVTNTALSYSPVDDLHSRNHRPAREGKFIFIQYMMVLLLLGSGSGGAASTVYGAAVGDTGQQQAYEHMVFLGDSLTAGYEPEVNADAYDGFTTRLAEQELFRGRSQAINDGILGLTSEGLKNYMDAITAGRSISTANIQTGLPGSSRTLDGAQTARDIRNADLITITIGGNDFLNALGSLTALPQDLSSIDLTPITQGYRSHITSIVDQLTTLNPKAVIVIADQYQPVPMLAGAGLYRDLNKAAASFSQIVEETVDHYKQQGLDVRVAHVATAFQGQELAMTHIAEGDIHPNAAGYESMAAAFSKAIWGEQSYITPPASGTGTAGPVIYTNGRQLKTADQPVVRSGRTYVALRDVTAALGARVSWSAANRSAVISSGTQQITIPLNSKMIMVKGKRVSTDTAAFMKGSGSNSKVYVPLSLLADTLGYDVHYVNRWKAVFIRN